jgi:acetyl-CoA carboxylase biotin carboxyl carrier protein
MAVQSTDHETGGVPGRSTQREVAVSRQRNLSRAQAPAAKWRLAGRQNPGHHLPSDNATAVRRDNHAIFPASFKPVNLTHDDVQEILRLLDASPFDELHLETDRFKLILRRSGREPGGWTQERRTLARPQPITGAKIPESAPPSARSGEVAQRSSEGIFEIRPPIIGTFYRAPKPGATPFVEVGSVVTEDSVVGIVETMKLMNSIYAGVRGRVVEICVADAEFVEQDRVLIRVQAEKA